jgi:peptidylprolyl isomerase/peptidyl-prolyl cis-trans isomerase B (cyclophilin B)
MKKLSLIGLLMITVFMSCKKSTPKTEDTPQAATEQIIELKTSFGSMYIWLYKQTPLHRANFLSLAETGYYDSCTFHRIIQDFVIQGGDPNSKDSDPSNDGSGGPAYTIPAEFVDSLKHDYGAIGAARTNNPAKASNGSQFYIVTNKAGQHSLDKNYTVFGKLLSGHDIAYTISTQQKDGSDRPITDIKMDVNVVKKTLEQLKTEFNFIP